MNLITQEAYNICLELQYKNPTIISQLQPDILNQLVKTSIDCPEKPEDYQVKVVETERVLYDSICLTSGGADSTIAWYLNNKPQGLYIDVGQPYKEKELDSIKYHEISYETVFFRSLSNAMWKHIIPGRNFLFLAAAAERVKDGGEIFFGVTQGEGFDSGKGDKSMVFVDLFLDWYYAVSGKIIDITTFEEHTKAGWLKEFKEAGFDIDLIRHHTVTCFSEGKQCGQCQACLRKYLSFISAFELDTHEDYRVHPMIGCKEYVLKYTSNLGNALANSDYSHYSHTRCMEDLAAIEKAKSL